MGIVMSKTRGLDNKKRRTGIIFRLFIYFAVFIVFAILTVWVFQVLLLNKFYKTSKMEEMTDTALLLKNSVESDDIESVANNCSARYLISIIVYRINDNKVYTVVDSESMNNGVVLHLTASRISELYLDTKENGGSYWQEMNFVVINQGIFGNSVVADGSVDSNGENIASMIYTEIVPTDGEDEYFIILNSELTPLRATVNTLEKQFSWIIIILVVGAMVLSVLVANNISKPLIKMNESAKRLAKGDYNIDFTSKKGFKETQELADTLNYAAEELIKTDNLQKELISNVSHDMRTPLTMIIGYSEVMRDIPLENTPENVQVIIDEATRLTDLVNETLNLSKLHAKTVAPELIRLNLTEVVRQTQYRYEKLTQKDGYNIEYLADCSVEVMADRTMLLQVIYNLINNAINYTGEDKTVKIIQEVRGERVRISVKDTGEGIPADKLDKIWDRYYKIDKVHKRATVGTGLGLSIVKEVLKAHAAAYGVDSVVGEGSTFWFELPCAIPENNDETNERLQK